MFIKSEPSPLDASYPAINSRFKLACVRSLAVFKQSCVACNTPIPEKTGSCMQARLNSPLAFKMADEMPGKNEQIRMYVG